jgi:hypothetical protein
MNIKHTTPKAKAIRKALYKEEVHTKPKKEKPFIFTLASTNSINTSNAQQKGRKIYLNQFTNNSYRSISNNNLSVNGSSSIVGAKFVNNNKNKMQLKYPLKVNSSFHVHKPQTIVKSTTQVVIKNNNVSKVKQSLTRNPSFSKQNKSLNSTRQLSEKSLTKVHNTLTPRNSNSTKAIYVRLKKSDDNINKELLMKIKSQRNKIKEEALHKKYKNDEMKLQIYEMKTKLNQIVNERLKTEILKLEQLEKQCLNSLQKTQNKSKTILNKTNNITKGSTNSSPQVKLFHSHSQNVTRKRK